MTKNNNQEGISSLANVTKGNAWDLQENDVVSLWQAAEKEDDIRENGRHYMDILHGAFELEELKVDKPEVIKKYEARGMTIAELPYGEGTKKWGIKKRAINRVTDLSYENITHISAAKLVEVLERNFGGGWDSLSQGIRDIIEHGFDISTTTLPKDRLKKKGGMYEMKVNDGFEVLEIEKGSWVEAIFAKAKPKVEKHSILLGDDNRSHFDDEDGDNEDMDLPEDTYNMPDEDEDLDEDALTAESYRTTIDEKPEDLDITVDDLDDEEY